jgi:energy-coupling factor transport system ATP-binding protein
VLPFADMLVYIPGPGESVTVGDPRSVLERMTQVPPLVALGKALDWSPLPLTTAEGRDFADKLSVQPARSLDRSERGVPPILRVDAVEVAYGSKVAVRDADLALRPGEIVTLMGRNGSGKTTLLRAMVGLTRPRKGHITLDGEDIAGMDTAEICRDVGYLPQDPNALLFAETVREEVTITLKNHGLNADAVPIPPDALLARLHLTFKAEAYPRDLSAGERQRTALAAMMITHPRVILLDEPTRGLDYRSKQGLLDLLRGWRAEGLAVLVVTHDVELAAAAADRVLLMRGGEIVERGAPSRVLRRAEAFTPQIARVFPETDWLTVDDALAGLQGQ